MQITKEQLEKDIAVVTQNISTLEASLNQNRGALATLELMLEYVKKEPEPSISHTNISDLNKARQDADTALIAKAVEADGFETIVYDHAGERA